MRGYCWFILNIILLCFKESTSESQNSSENNVKREVKLLRKRNSHDAETIYQEYAREVIAHDVISARYCKKNTVSEPQEVYGHSDYKLILPFKDYNAENVQIKIKHRVIYTNDGPMARVKDIRKLPDFVDTKEASWAPTAAGIQITIPYKLNRLSKNSCNAQFNINDQELLVPREESDNMRNMSNSSNSEKSPIGLNKQTLDLNFGINPKLFISKPLAENNVTLEMNKDIDEKSPNLVKNTGVKMNLENNGGENKTIKIHQDLLDLIFSNEPNSNTDLVMVRTSDFGTAAKNNQSNVNEISQTKTNEMDQSLLNLIFNEREQMSQNQNPNAQINDQLKNQQQNGVQINQNVLDQIFDSKPSSNTGLIMVTTRDFGADTKIYQPNENVPNNRPQSINQNLLDLIFNK